ncbi:MAG: hypothetical protein DRN88_03620 [Candidatus Hydrothermarchaeota archaeon]|nr:MAG: hypothetical protein DRN88_03620 [Candidatus Hydrothermarchaeota archaeon]
MVSISISEAQDKIKELVERYKRVAAEGKEKEYNEVKPAFAYVVCPSFFNRTYNFPHRNFNKEVRCSKNRY